MDSAKELRERFLLDRFLEVQRLSPNETERLKPPNPDFLINLEGRKVGIELTEIFVRSRKSETHSQPRKVPFLQALATTTDRIVSKAREIYFDAESPPVKAQILFSKRITLDKKKGDQIAKLIAGKIHEMGIQNSQVIWRSNEGEGEETLLSESIASIHAHRVPNLQLARWVVANTAGWVHTLTPKHLQERIDAKAEKIDAYRKNTEGIWLLIIADQTRPSQKLTCPSDFPWDSLSSPFERTFYYSYPDGVIELKKVSFR